MLSRYCTWLKQSTDRGGRVLNREPAAGRTSPVLDMLPTELLIQITDYLRPPSLHEHTPREIRDLWTLSLTCKALNIISTPHLYSAFSIEHSAASLRIFLRTLIERPQLVRHVQHIELWAWEDFGHARPNTADLALFLRAALPLLADGMYHGAFTSALKKGSHEAETILLLLIAKHVEHLVLYLPLTEGGTSNVPHVPSEMVRGQGALFSNFMRDIAKTESLNCLPKLRDVNAVAGRHEEDSLTITGEQLQILFTQHQAHSFSAEGLATLHATLDGSPRWPVNNSTSNIKKLHLSKCNIAADSLIGMLAACSVLEDVSIRWAGCLTGDRSKYKFMADVRFDEIGKALAQHAATLKSLVLDTAFSGKVGVEETSGIGSMRLFKELEILEIDDSFICGDFFDLNWNDHWSIGELPEFLPGFFPPNLKTFCLHTRKHFLLALDCFSEIAAFAPMRSIEQLELTFPLLENEMTEELRHAIESTNSVEHCMSFMQHPQDAHEVMIWKVGYSSCDSDLKDYAVAAAQAINQYMDYSDDDEIGEDEDGDANVEEGEG